MTIPPQNVPSWTALFSGISYSARAFVAYIFGDKVESLPAYLCYQMKGLTIFSKNIVPPVLQSNTFYSSTISKIYVPMESVEEYKSQWNKYADKIVGYDFD